MTRAGPGHYSWPDARHPSREASTFRGSSTAARSTGSPIEPTSGNTEVTAEGRRVALFLATAGGAGYAPVAPGTFGSAVGVLLYLPLSRLTPWLFVVTVLALLFVGIWASDEAERAFATKDDGRIVIDEVVGQLLTLAPLVLIGSEWVVRSALWLLAGFLLFRALDIAKFGPIGWAERSFRNGAGVMMDDVVAGVIGGVVLGSLYVAAVAFGVSS